MTVSVTICKNEDPKVLLIVTTNCNGGSGLKQWASVDKNADSKVHSTATTNCNASSGLQQWTSVEQYMFAIEYLLHS